MSSMPTLCKLQPSCHYLRTDSLPAFFQAAVALWSSTMTTPSFLSSGSPSPGKVCPECNKNILSKPLSFLYSGYCLLNSFTKKSNFLLTKWGTVDNRWLVLGSGLTVQILRSSPALSTRVQMFQGWIESKDSSPTISSTHLSFSCKNTTHLTQVANLKQANRFKEHIQKSDTHTHIHTHTSNLIATHFVLARSQARRWCILYKEMSWTWRPESWRSKHGMRLFLTDSASKRHAPIKYTVKTLSGPALIFMPVWR